MKIKQAFVNYWKLFATKHEVLLNLYILSGKKTTKVAKFAVTAQKLMTNCPTDTKANRLSTCHPLCMGTQGNKCPKIK